MNLFTKLAALAALALPAALSSSAAIRTTDVDLSNFVRKPAYSRQAFNSARFNTVQEINAHLEGRRADRAVAADLPISLGPTHVIGDLDGPDGQMWFYTIDLENNVVHHEYFDELFLQKYTINIYDEEMNLIGTIHDKMRYADDEKKVPAIDILPLATRHFFNDDDKIEIALGLAINSTTPGHNHYRTVAYQLDGEKDAEGYDLIVATLPELVASVAYAYDGSDDIYMVLMDTYSTYEGNVDDIDFYEILDTPAYWDLMCSNFASFGVYKKFDAQGNPQKILSYDICYQNLPGDQENAPMVIPVVKDGVPYIAFSQYKETLFNPYYNFYEDITQREENELLIDIYRMGDTAELVQHTSVPFTVDEEATGSFYSIGNLLYAGDVRFDATGKASFILTKGNYTSISDEKLDYSYYTCSPDGKVTGVVFEHADSNLPMSDIEGFEPQQMFVSISDEGEYFFHFMDMTSLKEVCRFSYLFPLDEYSDPERLTSNIDRARVGDSYMYVDELRMPVEEDDNTYLRVLWLKKDGTFDHIDEVNMGQNVQYAMSYIESAMLNPTLYHSDDHMEYMMLIKRAQDDGTRTEELLIAKARSKEYPEGKDVLLVTPDHRGALAAITPYASVGLNKLAITFKDDNSNLHCDVYALPLDSEIDGIAIATPDAADCAITLNGNILSAEGLAIEVFNMQGLRVMSTTGSADISTLAPGVYVAVAGESALKIVKN